MQLTLYADGGTRGNPGPSAAGAVLKDSSGKVIARISKFLGTATNNQAEYAALIFGCEKACELGATELSIFLDSELVVEQISGRWKIKVPHLKKAAEKAHALLAGFKKWEIKHIPREKNFEADKLVNDVLDKKGYKKSSRWSR